MYRVDKTAWESFYAGMRRPLTAGEYAVGYNAAVSLVDDWITGHINDVYTNRDWLDSLSAVELVDWIKNTASAMSDAELLRWMEEKHETD